MQAIHQAPSFAAPRVRGADVDAAADRVLSNIDEFTGWLANECGFKDRVSSDYETRVPGRLTNAPLETLVHAALVATDRGDAETLLEAMKLVVSRYLVEHDVAIGRIAGDLAAEALVEG